MNKKSLFSLIALGLIGLIISSCASKKETLEVTECNFPDAPSHKAPLWVCGGEVEGVEVSAVGFSEKSKASLNFKKQQAVANARVDLAQQIQSDMQGKLKTFESSKGEGEDETIEKFSSNVVQQLTNQSLKGTRVLKQITSPNGMLYVLVGLDKKLYDGFVKETLKSSYQKDNKISEEDFKKLEKSLTE